MTDTREIDYIKEVTSVLRVVTNLLDKVDDIQLVDDSDMQVAIDRLQTARQILLRVDDLTTCELPF